MSPSSDTVLVYPDPRLSKVCAEIGDISREELHDIRTRLIDAMLDNRAVGMSAPQIGIDARCFVMRSLDPTGTVDQYKSAWFFCNPTVMSHSTDKTLSMEGCVSVPGTFVKVMRYPDIDLMYFDPNREKEVGLPDFFTDGWGEHACFSGLEAFVVQHEIDHLNGITIMNGVAERLGYVSINE